LRTGPRRCASRLAREPCAAAGGGAWPRRLC